MYTATFYSYKGGVGRTMAVVNVAFDLAQSGRRVLVVDFDLESPGIDTFSLLRPPQPTPGIVEFVNEYLQSNAVPDVRSYVYQPYASDAGGALSVMPSGIRDSSYEERLSRINWSSLYDSRDGYLLFEDLKEQWRQLLCPDYVFIDSRTGHTDIAGICTRQLPDVVTALFFPNEQNLWGLKHVVDAVRAEASGSRAKTIELLFAMSNVPDIDDEDEILAERMIAFRRALGYRDSDLHTIHRYDSLALLNQVIFTRDRPRSRLAREYRALGSSIAERNPEDRAGALGYLKGLIRRGAYRSAYRGSAGYSEATTTRLSKLAALHPTDGEVLYALARVKHQARQFRDAIDLMRNAIRVGYRKAGVFLTLAESLVMTGHAAEAAESIRSVLSDEDATVGHLLQAVELMRGASADDVLRTIATSAAVTRLSPADQLLLAGALQWNRREFEAAHPIVEQLSTAESSPPDVRAAARTLMILGWMARGEFRSALEAFGTERPEPSMLGLPDVFNYAMAEWALTGLPHTDMFERVVEIRSSVSRTNANFSQCLAVAYWACGDARRAYELLAEALQAVAVSSQPQFSCWSYQMRTPRGFVADCEGITKMFGDKTVQPLFMRPAGGEAAN